MTKMTKATYTERVNIAAKNLVARHNAGKKVTSTTAWNEVYITVFDGANCAKVDSAYRYMPDTIAAVKRAAKAYL
jgi:hypothetical protein